ncbi:MAG: hypothetical protein ACREMB_06785 [Candidatus Rokuibacteriota bacterium]
MSVVPIVPTLDGFNLTSETIANTDSRTVRTVFTSLQKGSYQFRIFVSTAGFTATVLRRLFSIHAHGTLPQTAPGSGE